MTKTKSTPKRTRGPAKLATSRGARSVDVSDEPAPRPESTEGLDGDGLRSRPVVCLELDVDDFTHRADVVPGVVHPAVSLASRGITSPATSRSCWRGPATIARYRHHPSFDLWSSAERPHGAPREGRCRLVHET